MQISIEPVGSDIGRVSWPQHSDPDQLERTLAATADDALGGGRFRRLELAVPAADRYARRAALRSGFRQEGVRRAALVGADGSAADEVMFSRLVGDQVGGPYGFSAVMNTALPRTRVIAHVLMRDADGRVLFCETRFKQDWELPGGIVEAFETPRAAAVREVREELGVDLQLGGLLALDWMPPYLGWDDALELIFDGGTVTEAELSGFVLQPSEIAAVRLCTLAEAGPHLIPLSLRRLTIITALPPEATVLLENGLLPG